MTQDFGKEIGIVTKVSHARTQRIAHQLFPPTSAASSTSASSASASASAGSPTKQDGACLFALKTTETAAATCALVATSPLLDNIGGAYFEDCALSTQFVKVTSGIARAFSLIWARHGLRRSKDEGRRRTFAAPRVRRSCGRCRWTCSKASSTKATSG